MGTAEHLRATSLCLTGVDNGHLVESFDYARSLITTNAFGDAIDSVAPATGMASGRKVHYKLLGLAIRRDGGKVLSIVDVP